MLTVDKSCYETVGFRTVSHHIALVSDNVCKCRTHTYSVAAVGLVLLRGIHRSVSSHARHAETKGSFHYPIAKEPIEYGIFLLICMGTFVY